MTFCRIITIPGDNCWIIVGADGSRGYYIKRTRVRVLITKADPIFPERKTKKTRRKREEEST